VVVRCSAAGGFQSRNSVKIDNAQKISKTHEMSHMIKIHKKEKRDKKKKKIMRWIYLPTYVGMVL